MKEIGKNGLTKKISDKLKQARQWHLNVHGHKMQMLGVPDILCCVDSMFVAIETKVDDNKPTPLQTHNLKGIAKSGGIALVITYENKNDTIIVENWTKNTTQKYDSKKFLSEILIQEVC